MSPKPPTRPLPRTATAAAAVIAASLAAPGLRGDFVEFVLEDVTDVLSGPGCVPPAGMQTLRLYATFDDPADSALAVDALLQATAPWFQLPPAINLNFAPCLVTPCIPSSELYDSWVTIGGPGDPSCAQIAVDPGCGPVLGWGVVTFDCGYFDSGPATPVKPSPAGCVLLGQFTAANGFSISGALQITWRDGGGPVTLSTFNGVLPKQSGGCATCVGDLDNDGVIDGADMGYLLGVWGTGDPAGDINNDGTVNGADLGLLVAGWGSC